MERKTGGLFDTVQAGNATVAGKASNDCMDFDDVESCRSLVPGEAGGEVLLDVPFELTEADYLDSFMDLSNFLLPDEVMKESENTSPAVEEIKVDPMIDFSNLIQQLDGDSIEDKTVPDTFLQSQKRKYSESFDVGVEFVQSEEIVVEQSVPDHDYVTKKMRSAPAVATVEASPSTSSSVVVAEKPKNKYRERRDKNNVASRRSREIRKEKFTSMNKEADHLEVRNEELRKKIVELEDLAKIMKAELIKKMTTK